MLYDHCRRARHIRRRKRRVHNMAVFGIAMIGLVAIMGATANARPVVEPVIGIDLGTTYSCVSIWENGKAIILPNDLGNRVTASYVSWTHDGDRLIGDSAKNQAAINPENTVFDVKRLIGRKYTDKTVQADKTLLPYKIVDRGNKPYVEVNTGSEAAQQYSPEEISAMILSKMKAIAESYEGQEIKRAVITVPAYFTNEQRQATKDAGRIAGLHVERVINEPTAAAIAYGVQHDSDEEKTILVFDLGGGTFDVTLMTLDGGVFSVESVNGDTHLGGEDFDQQVMKYFAKKFQKKHNLDITKDKTSLSKLRREVERVKRALSSQHQARLEIESLYKGIDFSETLTRSRFEEINMDLFKKTLDPVRQVLKDSGFKKGEVDEILLVGGSTRIPKIKSLLKDYFGKEPNTGINPDEAVALGASIQAAVISGASSRESSPLVLDNIPLSLGIETVGGIKTTIIKKDSKFPTKKTKTFTTYSDNQNTVTIAIYEGERAMVKDNVLLGNFELSGIPPAPRSVPQIEVTFEVDKDSILKVSAKVSGSNNQEEITISSHTGRLTEEEIQRAIDDAEKNKVQDEKIRKTKMAEASLEGYLYNIRNNLKDNQEISEVEHEEIETLVQDALDWMDENAGEADYDMYNEKLQEVSNIINPILKQSSSSSFNENDYHEGEEDDFDFDEHEEL